MLLLFTQRKQSRFGVLTVMCSPTHAVLTTPQLLLIRSLQQNTSTEKKTKNIPKNITTTVTFWLKHRGDIWNTLLIVTLYFVCMILERFAPICVLIW
jgi:hypothetical protein